MSRRIKALRTAAAATALLCLCACEDGANMPFLQSKDDGAGAPAAGEAIERDVEAPEVFQAAEAGLWDGRPSLGGVWVAHPDVKEPERVLIRNETNGESVVGALFRREREIPGPRLQVSSDAAAALSMLPGAPVDLNVTALRREIVVPEPAPAAAEEPPAAEALPSAGGISETALDPIAGAAAAIEAADETPPAAAPAEAAGASRPKQRPQSQPRPQAQKSSLDKPYIQIGIFNVEANAERTADQMRSAGMIPAVRSQSADGKPFWRVVVGPAQNKTERSALLKSVKATGFSDAYAVTN